jgi:hypothetical protein
MCAKKRTLARIDLKRKGIGIRILHIHTNHATKVKAPNEKAGQMISINHTPNKQLDELAGRLDLDQFPIKKRFFYGIWKRRSKQELRTQIEIELLPERKP